MRPSDKAWLTLAASILTWDCLCPSDEMLSEASARYLHARPLLWPLMVIFTAGHLLHIWPDRCDPFSIAARLFGRTP